MTVPPAEVRAVAVRALEVLGPDLFLRLSDDAADRLAEAVLAGLSRDPRRRTCRDARRAGRALPAALGSVPLRLD